MQSERPSGETILDAFRRLAELASSERLVEYGDEFLSAEAFWKLVVRKAANVRLACKDLLKRELRPGERVGLEITPSLDLLSDMVAILFAGAAYVPFSARDPEERTGFVLDDAEVSMTVSAGAVACRARDLGVTAGSPRLAYIIYTSGSTGRPKGVKISHDALWHYFKWFGSLSLSADCQRIDLSSSLTFDASVTTSLIALALGKQISVCSESVKSSPRAFVSYLAEKRLDLCKCTPSFFRLLANEARQHGTDLHRPVSWLLTGEPMDPHDVKDWLDRHPEDIFYNSYGPTEATVTVSKVRIDRHNITRYAHHVPIAQRDRSAGLHVLTKTLTPSPIGVRGELYLEGAVLADGYQSDDALTEKAFIRDAHGRRLYRTGDQVAATSDDEIYYYGRLDDQVKVQGVRVELEETRQAICSHPEVADAHVVALADAGGTSLAAFVVPKAQASDVAHFRAQLLTHLASKLPRAAVPGAVVLLDSLPLNRAGKVDRHALKLRLLAQPPPVKRKLVADAVEMAILGIWRERLPGRKIGAETSFFDIGGNSLLAMEVVDRVNRHFGCSLAAASLFQSPTIRLLAKVVGGLRRDTHVHRFKDEGGAPLLVLIHPATGLVMPYMTLHESMGGIGVWGVSNDRFGDERQPYRSLEEMAESYLSALAPLCEGRRLVVGGFCTGGAVAFEMARRLRARGKGPDGLVLIDSFKLERMREKAAWETYHRAFLARVGIDDDSELAKRIAVEIERNRCLVATYKPSLLESTPTLILQCRQVNDDDVDRPAIERLMKRQNGWAEVLDPDRVQVQSLDSSHKTIMQERASIAMAGAATRAFVRSVTGSRLASN